MDEQRPSISPDSPLYGDRPPAPRLWDFKLLRFPVIEFVVGGILTFVGFTLIGSDNPGAPLSFLFILVPSVIVFGGMYLLTIPLHFRPVDEFWWDFVALAPGVLGVLLAVKDEESLFYLITLPVALSLLLRRFTAFILWKNGRVPQPTSARI